MAYKDPARKLLMDKLYYARHKVELFKRYGAKQTAYHRIWRAKPENKEKIKIRMAAYRKRAWDTKGKARCIARKALKRGSNYKPAHVSEFIASVRAKRRIRCYYCSQFVSGKAAHIEHIIPLAATGTHEISNLCAACPQCNLSKHVKTILEWKRHGQMIMPL